MPANIQGVYNVNYSPPPTVKEFHRSKAFVRGLRGPIGSAKSTACCFEIFRRMAKQAPGPDGIRRSRWAVIRNTYPELEMTTIKTWLYWFPENIFGRFRRKVPYLHVVKFNDVEAEVYFMAANSEDDVSKLLSLELTGAWINEAREVPLAILNGATERVGRYPAMKEGGPTWHGVIMDTNAPEEDHWWPQMAGDTPAPEDVHVPEDWRFFTQPGALIEKSDGSRTYFELNPDAENLANLPRKYYQNAMQGKSTNHIRVYLCNRYGSVKEGKLVYEREWNEDLHLARKPLEHIPGCTIYVGLDFGRTPAACFSQKTPFGQWQDIHEIVEEDIGAERFAQLLKSECQRLYPRAQFEFYGDPAGGHGSQTSERTYFDILKAAGIPVRPAPTQDPAARREAGGRPLERLIDGKPGYLLSPNCHFLLKGFRQKFRYKQIQQSGGGSYYSETPEKNIWSHIHEARQYAYAGGGEYGEVVGKNNRKRKTAKAWKGFNPMGAFS